MKFKFLTVSVALVFAFCSIGQVVERDELNRNPLAAVLEILREKDAEDE